VESADFLVFGGRSKYTVIRACRILGYARFDRILEIDLPPDCRKLGPETGCTRFWVILAIFGDF